MKSFTLVGLVKVASTTSDVDAGLASARVGASDDDVSIASALTVPFWVSFRMESLRMSLAEGSATCSELKGSLKIWARTEVVKLKAWLHLD